MLSHEVCGVSAPQYNLPTCYDNWPCPYTLFAVSSDPLSRCPTPLSVFHLLPCFHCPSFRLAPCVPLYGIATLDQV